MRHYLIIDPAAVMPSLQFIMSSDGDGVEYFYNSKKTSLPWGPYNRGNELPNMYGFDARCLETEEDWKHVEWKTWDCVFVIFPLHPSIGHNVANSKDYFIKLVNRLHESCETKKFVIIDNSDEPVCYDSQMKELGIQYDLVFKKEFIRHSAVYPTHFKPFPFVMLGFQDVLWLLNERKFFVAPEEKIDRVYWAGSSTHAQNPDIRNYYDRRQFLTECADLLTTAGPVSGRRYANNEYMNNMGKSKYFLYLRGQAKLTRRMFEGMAVGSLMLLEDTGVTLNLQGKGFPEEVCFHLPEELREKISKLRADSELYTHCLKEQERIIQENFTYSAIKKYILRYI